MRNVYTLGMALSLLSLTISCSQPLDAPPLDNAPRSPEAIANSAPITIDGSSTVYPITDEMTKRFQQEVPNAPDISVTFSGTGGGFRMFCTGQTDISNASRPITPKEMAECKAKGVEYIELPIAFDALTVVVNSANTWAETMTVKDLQKLWEPSAEAKITRWNQLQADWPDETIALYGPGKDSGTFDYFTDVIVGEDGASRADYNASENDDELVQGVKDNPNALGYFGFAYYKESQGSLNALAIDSGNGPVEPSGETIRSNAYQPLARPLFIYVNVDNLDANPALAAFVELYLSNARTVVDDVGYEPLPNEVYAIAMGHFLDRKVGSVFDGKASSDLTIEQLLEKEKAF